MGTNGQDEDTPERVAKGAMFFAGLKLLQTMNLCFAGSFPVLLRFGTPPKQIGPFIGITGVCLNFLAAVGDMLGFGLGLANLWRFFMAAVIATFTTLSPFIVQCRLTFICLRCSGYDVVRKYYNWLCFSAFIYQGDALLCPATWGFQSAWFFLAMEITNILIPIIHFIAWLFFRWCGGKDILFWKLCFHLGSMVFFTGVCVVVWIIVFAGNCFKKGRGGKKKNPTQDAAVDADNWGDPGNCDATDLTGVTNQPTDATNGLTEAFEGYGILYVLDIKTHMRLWIVVIESTID